MTREERRIHRLLERGGAVECPGCGGVSAWAWDDIDLTIGLARASSTPASWECGHCGSSWLHAEASAGEELEALLLAMGGRQP